MSQDDMPIELVRLSYIKLGDTFAVRFTINGIEQSLILTPQIDQTLLVSSIFKTIMVLADPVGPCINEVPY